MNIRFLIPASTLLLACASSWASIGRAGGGPLFQAPFGARPFAMGQAYAAYGDDLFGMSYNPATLGRLKDSQVAAQLSQIPVDIPKSSTRPATPRGASARRTTC